MLTAIHDVMKLRSLLPAVRPEHAPYHGLAAGAVIHDHDVALAYVLSHDPDALPCFARLPPAQKASVLFTQSKLGFNHGWLVQVDAAGLPPECLPRPPECILSGFASAFGEHLEWLRSASQLAHDRLWLPSDCLLIDGSSAAPHAPRLTGARLLPTPRD